MFKSWKSVSGDCSEYQRHINGPIFSPLRLLGFQYLKGTEPCKANLYIMRHQYLRGSVVAVLFWGPTTDSRRDFCFVRTICGSFFGLQVPANWSFCFFYFFSATFFLSGQRNSWEGSAPWVSFVGRQSPQIELYKSPLSLYCNNLDVVFRIRIIHPTLLQSSDTFI